MSSNNAKGVSVAGLPQVKQVYTPRFNQIDLSSVEMHTAVGNRNHDKIRSPRASTASESGVNQASIQEWLKARPHTVKPVEKDVITGYLIGRQLDEAQILKEKRETQRSYLKKVEQDNENNLKSRAEDTQSRTTTHRHSSSPARSPSPSTDYDTTSDCGHKFGGDEENQRARSKALQREALEYNIKFAEERRCLPRNPSTQQKINNPIEHLEISKMNTKPFCIGNSVSEAEVRNKILAERRQYHERLREDEEINKKLHDEERYQDASSISPSKRSPRSPRTVPYTAAGEYINITGWAGLNVGGSASGNTASVQNLHAKVHRQDQYRNLLDAQRKESICIQQQNEEQYAKQLKAAGTKLPYGNF